MTVVWRNSLMLAHLPGRMSQPSRKGVTFAIATNPNKLPTLSNNVVVWPSYTIRDFATTGRENEKKPKCKLFKMNYVVCLP